MLCTWGSVRHIGLRQNSLTPKYVHRSEGSSGTPSFHTCVIYRLSVILLEGGGGAKKNNKNDGKANEATELDRKGKVLIGKENKSENKVIPF